MGSWGTGLYDNDDSVDTREETLALLGKGISPDEVAQAVVASFCSGTETNIDNNDVLLALAETLKKYGKHSDFASDHALRILNSEEEVERWGQYGKERRKVLEDLRIALSSETPPRRVPKPQKIKVNPYTVGQHILYADAKENAQILLRVVGEEKDSRGTYPHVTILDWDGSDSGLHEPEKLLPLLTDISPMKRHIYLGAIIIGGRFKKENLIVLPETHHPESNDQVATYVAQWGMLVDLVRKAARTPPSTIRRD